ncbi:NADH-quinone oxidoreductase subunit NuoE [Microbacter margulisiae]|uniref:NADH-quinone oxidoreductase subunit E n=1 Tax=Microbacter margulisiae TaxID=1350067 RepID=A0A7W5H139_9PORP|nr:NADH-quinone oxidoreductase subunit NuoE [Microbacter margulisiae]MBB3186305.1 NADH-quinone oxidoreductase subunit E [Microbacter margulisiae]
MSDKHFHHKLYVKKNIDVAFSPDTLRKVESILSHYPEDQKKSALIPVLQIAQEEFGGSLNVDIMDYVASLLNITPIEVYEVATFYSQFYLDPVGKYVIEVCQTGPCAICGGEDVLHYLEQKLKIKVGETTEDKLFTLKAVECLGACGSAPVMQVNTEFYEYLNLDKIDDILETLRKESALPKPEKQTWKERLS